MRILVLQESNWIERGPHQQHHLMERMSERNSEIWVIDYDILWQSKKSRKIFKKTEKMHLRGKVTANSKITLIRPAVVQIPVLCYFSIPLSHTYEIIKSLIVLRPNVVISFGILNAFFGLLVSKAFRVPFVCYLIDHLHTLLPLKPAIPLAKTLERFVIKNSNRVFVINKGLSDYAVSMGASPSNVMLIPGGVDFKKYSSALIKRGAVRSRYGIDDGTAVLFFMGWIYDFSGIKEVAKALSKWGGPEKFALMVVGDGDAFGDIKRIKDESQMQNILLLGKQPFERIPELLSAADICLLPAYPDAPEMQNIVPIKIYEYLAAGKPVVCTKLPGIVKEFGFGCGIRYVDSPENALAECAKILRTVDLEEETRTILKFAENFDWKMIMDNFERELLFTSNLS